MLRHEEKNRIQGTNSIQTQKQNRLLVLRVIRDKRVTSRVEIAQLTGLKQATITNIAGDLMEMGYIKETGLINGENGRRVTGLALNEEKMQVLVLRITSSYYVTGVYTVYGECLKVQKTFFNCFEHFDDALRQMAERLEEYRRQAGQRVVLGIGAVLHGVTQKVQRGYLTRQNGIMPLEQILQERFHCPVYLEKTSNMAAYYEWEKRRRRGEPVHSLVSIMVGYTVDMGLICNEEIFRGQELASNDFGHTTINFDGPLCSCGRRGCIHQYVSVEAVKRRAGELKKDYPDSPVNGGSNIRDIIEAFYSQDPLAVQLYREQGRYLGMVLANQIIALNPDEIILGDEIPNSDAFKLMLWEETVKQLPPAMADAARFRIKLSEEPRVTRNDVSLKGITNYIVRMQFREMELE